MFCNLLLLFYHLHRAPVYSAAGVFVLLEMKQGESRASSRSNRMWKRAGEKLLTPTSNTCTAGANQAPVFYTNSDGFRKREHKLTYQGRTAKHLTSSPVFHLERRGLSPWAVYLGLQVSSHTFKSFWYTTATKDVQLLQDYFLWTKEKNLPVLMS